MPKLIRCICLIGFRQKVSWIEIMLLFIKQPTLYIKETKAQTFMCCYFTNNTMKPQFLNITDNLMVALEWSNKPSSRTAPSYRLKSNKRIMRNQGRTDLKLQVFKLPTGLHFSHGQIKNLYLCLYLIQLLQWHPFLRVVNKKISVWEFCPALCSVVKMQVTELWKQIF